jgi:hypothetical protein
MDILEETLGKTRRHHWNKEPRLRQEPRLGSRTTFGRIFRKTTVLEIRKRIVGTSIRLRKMSVRILWRGLPPPKQRLRTMDVRTQAISRTCGHTNQRKMMVKT